MSLRPKQWIARLKTCPHGGINHAELEALGISPDGVLDFSVCTNPFMPPPGLKEMLGSMGINAIESLRGNREQLRGVGLSDTDLKLLGIKPAGEAW